MQCITRYKQMFIEPTNKEEFTQAMEQYYATINDATANGAIFCGVCRGKVGLLLHSTFPQITKVEIICLTQCQCLFQARKCL